MEPTAEMRWWWAGDWPADVVQWFSGLPGAIAEEWRTDHYLRQPPRSDTGIKARAGDALDVKVRLGGARVVEVVEGVVGLLEHWTKWSFPLGSAGPARNDLDDFPGSWISVGKHRWLIEVDRCALELSAVTVADAAWWSLAAEADGEGDTGTGHLFTCLRWLGDQSPPAGLDLVADRSWGYPEQLSRLTRSSSVAAG